MSERSPIYLVFLGPPGAGKGTQAKRLSQRLGLAHIATGDLFRKHLQEQTKLGQLAQQYMRKGELVPDSVTIAMVEERLNEPDTEAGVIFDGFPRTVAQAEALDMLLAERGAAVTKAILIQVPEEVLVERLSGRRTCRAHGHVFHIKYNPPKVPGVCDYDGSELYQREDDKPETVRRRIQVYWEQTAPVIAYYRERGLLVEVDGNRDIDAVTQALLDVIADTAGAENDAA